MLRSILSEMIQECCPEKRKRLDNEIQAVRDQIAVVNEARGLLTDEKGLLRQIVDRVNGELKKKEVLKDPNTYLVLYGLRAFLQSRIDSLSEEIDRQKPVELLREKHRLKVLKESLRHDEEVASLLIGAINGDV